MYHLIFWSFWTHPSVFDLVHLILHLYFILAILVLWSYFFWLVMLSWTLAPLLWLSLIWTSDPSAALKNLPPFTIIWLIIPLTFSHSMKPGCNPPILTISFPHWHPLAFPFWTLLVLLVMVVGLAVIHKSFLKIKSFRARNFPSPVSFELMATKLTSGNKRKLSFLISIVLHLLKSLPFLTNSKTFLNFLFLYLLNLSSLATSTFTLILTWQHLTNFLAFLTTSISNSTYIFPTHDDGHTLDLLITRTSSDIITHLSHHESYQSDHKSFTFKFFSHIRPTTQRSVIHYRSFKTINIDNFKSDILSSPLYTNPASNSSDLSEQLSSTLNSILDIHAPLKSKIVVLRPHTPWINPEILAAKRERRSTRTIMASLEISLWPQEIQSPMQFCLDL